jgi:hypothetical protein
MKSRWPSQIIFGLALLGPIDASAEVFDAVTPQALADALGAAGAGDVIRLGPGEWPWVDLREMEGTSADPLVLTSIDPAQPARLSGLFIYQASGLEIRDLVLDYVFQPGDEVWTAPFEVVQSEGITLRRLLIDGDTAHGISDEADGYGYALGLSIAQSRGVTLDGSVIRGFTRGLGVSDSSDIRIAGNELHDMRITGMYFAAVSDVLIENNHIHDMRYAPTSTDHPDMLQFWTAGTTSPTTNVVIRRNLLASGAGNWTQSIFIRNELVDTGQASFEAMAYRHIRIEDNIVINAHLHGITVGESDGLVIANNAVLRNRTSEGQEPNPPLWTPQITVAPSSRNVVIERNITAAIAGFEEQPDWEVRDNLLAQDRAPTQPGYYARLFTNMPAGDPRDPASFAPLRGGPLDGTGIGPSWLGWRSPP